MANIASTTRRLSSTKQGARMEDLSSKKKQHFSQAANTARRRHGQAVIQEALLHMEHDFRDFEEAEEDRYVRFHFTALEEAVEAKETSPGFYEDVQGHSRPDVPSFLQYL